MITRPILAPNDDYSIQEKYFPFPGIYSPKADGYRCYKANGRSCTRSGKVHPNPHVASLIATLPDGVDGELTVGDSFRSAQSALSRTYGEPEFIYHIFDYVKDDLNRPFSDRLNDLSQLVLPSWCVILPQYTITTKEQLNSFEAWCLEQGYEGFMGRKPDGKYKCNRSTLKEALLLKGKRFTDAEAKITGFIEQMANNNETYQTELGFTARSGHQENKTGKGILGALQVTDIKTGVAFELGSGIGWDIQFREEVFNNQPKYQNAIVTYKFLDHGDYDKPRNASMKGFRDSFDMSE